MKHKIISLLLIAAITISLLPFMANDANAAFVSLPLDGHILSLENASKVYYDEYYDDDYCEYVLRQKQAYDICGLVPNNPMEVTLIVAERGKFNPKPCYDRKYVKQEATVAITPNADDNYRYNLRSSSVNANIHFGDLAAGKYTLFLYYLPYGAAGSYPVCYDSIDFAITPVGIDISGFAKNLTYGKSYGIPGTIKSNEKIAKVTAAVLDPKVGTPAFYRPNFYVNGKLMSGHVASAVWKSPSGTSLNLRGSTLDANIYFAGLARGNYVFEVTVYLKSGTCVTVEKPFTVK